MSTVLVVPVVLAPRVPLSPSSPLRVSCRNPHCVLELTLFQTLSRLVISLAYSQSPSSRLTLAFTRWLATAAVEVAVAGEAVAAVVAAEVAVSPSLCPTERHLLINAGWSGGNNAPIRNSRW